MGAEGAFDAYLDALLRGAFSSCERILEEQLESGAPLQRLYVDFVQAALYEVGARWERNELSVATEHLATAVTEGLLNRLFAAMTPAPPLGRRVLVATPAPELHQVGARIVADLFELQGWDSAFAGGDVQTERLLALVAELRPELVALSVTAAFNVPHLERALGALAGLPAVPSVIIGGRGLRHDGARLAAAHPFVAHVASLQELERVFFAPGEGVSGRARPAELLQ